MHFILFESLGGGVGANFRGEGGNSTSAPFRKNSFRTVCDLHFQAINGFSSLENYTSKNQDFDFRSTYSLQTMSNQK